MTRPTPAPDRPPVPRRPATARAARLGRGGRVALLAGGTDGTLPAEARVALTLRTGEG